MYFGFEHITVSYAKEVILHDICLEVPKGKITSVLGPNGCGKSSLLKTVFRTVNPKSGQVVLDGKPISEIPSRSVAKRIAYLPQMQASPTDTLVRTLVSYGRYPHQKFGRHLTKTDNEIIDRAISETGLESLSERTLSSLSGGERQRAWIAMRLAQEPEILILDEPTTYLDIGYRLEILELINRLNREHGITVLMVLHDLNLAARFSDRLYIIKDKSLYAAGTPTEVITAQNLCDVFGINAKVLFDEDNQCPHFIPLNAK